MMGAEPSKRLWARSETREGLSEMFTMNNTPVSTTADHPAHGEICWVGRPMDQVLVRSPVFPENGPMDSQETWAFWLVADL